MDDSPRLQLDPPPRHKPDAASFDTRRRALRRWLAELPVADPTTSGRLLRDALVEINRLQLSPSQRLRTLETLRGPLAGIVSAQARNVYGTDFPLPERNQVHARQVEQLLLELAAGYYSLIDERWRSSRKRRALPLQRSLHALNRLLFHYVCLYQPPPPGLWAHLHRLYATAESRGVAELSLPDPLAWRRRRSCADVYKHCLLLAAANPSRMRPQVLTQADALLERWAGLARLQHAEAASHEAFFVAPDRDAPPLRPSRLGVTGSSLYRLDTAPVVEAARRQLQPPPRWQFWHRSKQTPASRQLIENLLETLDLPPLRQSVRLPAQATMQVYMGLAQVHRGLVHYLGLSGLDPNQPRARFTSRDVPHEGHQEQPDDIWELIYPTELLHRLAKADRQPRPAAEPPPFDTLQSQEWSVINTSAGGYCLHARAACGYRVRVGELLLLRERNKPRTPWQLAVVRWMQQRPDGLQIGIQRLGAMPLPALLKLTHSGGEQDTLLRALLLPADPVSRRPSTLLVQPHALRTKQCVVLRGATGEREIVLADLLESGRGFMWFEYQTLQSAAMTPTEERELSMIPGG